MIDTRLATASGTATFAHLTSRAGQRLGRAHLRTAPAAPWVEGCPVRDTAALEDLLAALAHLGRTLLVPSHRETEASSPGRRRLGREYRILQSLEQLAVPRDWTAPRPADDIGRELDRAAFLIRSASDLWATHHSGDGHDRSPESSRMRHPATLGAATREWRILVVLASEIGEHLNPAHGPNRPAWDALRSTAAMRTPVTELDRSMLTVTVARPMLRVGVHEPAELALRVERLRHLAWSLAEGGSAPATVHATMAAVARDVAQAAAATHESIARRTDDPSARTRHMEAATRAGSDAAAWDDVAHLVVSLRSPHPMAHPIQIERLEIRRLLRRITTATEDEPHPETAWALVGIAEGFAAIAEDCLRALTATHERGDLFVAGHGVPNDALIRRPDLVHARLHDRIVPVPSLTMRRLAAAYRQAARGATPAASEPDASPPAA